MAARVVFNDTIIDSEDIEAMNLIPVLGVVPRLHVAAGSTAGQSGAPPPPVAEGGKAGAA
jgi:hypothetical protein